MRTEKIKPKYIQLKLDNALFHNFQEISNLFDEYGEIQTSKYKLEYEIEKKYYALRQKLTKQPVKLKWYHRKFLFKKFRDKTITELIDREEK